MRARKYLLIGLLLVFGSGLVAGDSELRVVFANVWSGLSYRGTLSVGTYETGEDRAFRYGLLVRQLGELDADIIIVNEANPLPRFAKRLSRDLSMEYVYAIRAGGVRLGPVGFPVNLREGSVILAKRGLGLTYIGNRDIIGGPTGNVGSFHLGNPTQVLAAKVSVAEGDLFLFATRWFDSEQATPDRLSLLADAYSAGSLSSDAYLSRVRDAIEGRDRRIREAERTVTYLEEIAGDSPLLFAGTLHAGPTTPEVELLDEAGLIDAWHDQPNGYTRDGERNTIMQRYFPPPSGLPPVRERMDYVFYRGTGVSTGVSLWNVALCLDTATLGIHPSDHFGLVVDLIVAEGPSESP
jgi:hypothetical protein